MFDKVSRRKCNSDQKSGSQNDETHQFLQTKALTDQATNKIGSDGANAVAPLEYLTSQGSPNAYMRESREIVVGTKDGGDVRDIVSIGLTLSFNE